MPENKTAERKRKTIRRCDTCEWWAKGGKISSPIPNSQRPIGTCHFGQIPQHRRTSDIDWCSHWQEIEYESDQF